MTKQEWRRVLRLILHELDAYRRANVHSDGLHHLILDTGLASADHALSQDDFWPGYVEGILRFALTLMGSYPDHRRRTKGRRKDDHYALNLHRTVAYNQSPEQKFRVLCAAINSKAFGLTKEIWQVLQPFYKEYGYRQPRPVTLAWFRQHYAATYADVFP